MKRRKITVCRAALLLFLLASTAALAQSPQADNEPVSELFKLAVDKAGDLAFDGELVWISDRVAQKLRGLDPKTGVEKKQLEAPGPWPTGLAFDGKLLWVADRTRERLFGIDIPRKLVMREIESPSNPLGLTYDGTYLWVADGKKIHRLTTEDGTTIVSFNAPAWDGASRPTEQLGLAFLDGYLWVADRDRDRIFRVHPEKGDVVDELPSPGPLPSGLTIMNGKLLVADADQRRIDAVALSALPRLVRRNPKKEVAVLRRQIVNHGPGTVAEAHVYVAIPKSGPGQALDGAPVFTPRPTDLVEDRYGQKFAHFKVEELKPNQSLDITMTARATLFDIRFHIDPDKVGSLRDIPAKIKKQYLADETKFAISHPSIRQHLKAALGDERRPYWMMRKIARYIQDKMFYELLGGWNIAPTVIDRGSGSCSEYTFVFISMCRAAGIPARYVGAIVIRGDDASTDNVFHRWPEVYLPGYGWIPADAQAGDKPEPEKQGDAIGGLPGRFLITTIGGGASEYIRWDYNSYGYWTCRGRCNVEDAHVGDWYPAGREPGKP